MSKISQNINEIKQQLPDGVKLIAVSKTKPVSLIEEAYEAGHRFFGENKAVELVEKANQLPEDIEWHFIGHLQRNKVKSILPYASLIHAVDSPRLLHEINKRAEQLNKTQRVLLQIHIAEEETKFGFEEEELLNFLEGHELSTMSHIEICGLMGMATNTADQAQVKREFHHLNEVFNRLKNSHFAHTPSFRELSIGMSNDYKIAIQEGSTMVRIGSAIFGSR